jgi:hypothetical protein
LLRAMRAAPRHPALVPWLLFAASALFVWWRNTEVGVLVDIAYIVNTGMRIALGEVPYRDFALAQAPGEFLIQAFLIRTLGPDYLVQILYVVLLGGVAAATAFLLVRRLLARAVALPAAVATIVCLPLIPLGIYSIYPHAFYDADACLLVMLALWATLAADDRPSPARWAIAGALIATPVWMKQNIGGAFLLVTLGAVVLGAAFDRTARARARWIVAGSAVTTAVALAFMQLAIGMDNYLRWALGYALSARGVTGDRLAAFVDPAGLAMGLLLLVLVAASRPLRERDRAVAFAVVGVIFLAAIFAPPGIPANAVAFFPPVMVAAVVLALVRAIREGPRFATLIPVIAFATVVGASESQGVKDSTFAMFPLLVVALAGLVRDLAWAVPRPLRIAPLTAAVIALALTVSGTLYTVTNARLRFVDVNVPGPAHGSTFPTLAGLSAHGPYIADLDEALAWARDHIPPDEPIVFLPGEDPAYFALGRRPPLPAVYFYDVATGYTAPELIAFADASHVRWVFVKDRRQLRQEVPLADDLARALTDGATLVTQLGAYRVYRR